MEINILKHGTKEDIVDGFVQLGNRALRRRYWRFVKGRPETSICPVCNNRSRLYLYPSIEEGYMNVLCEYCGDSIGKVKITDKGPRAFDFVKVTNYEEEKKDA